MTLVNTRAAFEKAVTDAVAAVDATVKMSYDNTPFTTPGKTSKFIRMSIGFNSSTLQNQGASSDYYTGFVRCDIYVPKVKGTAVFSAIGESVIDGLTSVNAANYTDTFNCSPRVGDVVGPTPVDLDDRSHFLGTITCQFSANA